MPTIYDKEADICKLKDDFAAMPKRIYAKNPKAVGRFYEQADAPSIGSERKHFYTDSYKMAA